MFIILGPGCITHFSSTYLLSRSLRKPRGSDLQTRLLQLDEHNSEDLDLHCSLCSLVLRERALPGSLASEWRPLAILHAVPLRGELVSTLLLLVVSDDSYDDDDDDDMW